MVVEISNWDEFQAMDSDRGADYVLVNDLDPDTEGYSGTGDSWEPIGPVDGFGEEFSGHFDGGGHSIKGIEITPSGEYSTAGIFSVTDSEALIENFAVSGFIDSVNDDGTLSRMGGVIGQMADAEDEVRNVFADVEIRNNGGDVRTHGGFCASLTRGRLSNVATVADVAGSSGERGGVFGRIATSATLDGIYSTGSAPDEGGFAGEDEAEFGDGRTATYWDTTTGPDTTAQGEDTVAEGLTADEMTGDSEMNLDYADTWDRLFGSDPDVETDSYPILQDIDRTAQLEFLGVRDFVLEVSAEPPTDVEEFTATLNGTLDLLDDRAESADLSFVYGVESGDNSTDSETLTEGDGTSQSISGLTNGTEYEFQVVGESTDPDGNAVTRESDIETFTTVSTEVVFDGLTVATEPFRGVLSGDLVDLGAYTSADVSIEYGKDDVTDNTVQLGTADGAESFESVTDPYPSDTTGLSFRLVGVGSEDGVEYTSSEVSFSTDPAEIGGIVPADDSVKRSTVIARNLTKDEDYGELEVDDSGRFSTPPQSGVENGDVLELLVSIQTGEGGRTRALYPTLGFEDR